MMADGTNAGRPAIATAPSATDPRVEARVTAIDRRRGVVRVVLVFSNTGPEPVRVTLDNSRTRLASSADRRLRRHRGLRGYKDRRRI